MTSVYNIKIDEEVSPALRDIIEFSKTFSDDLSKRKELENFLWLELTLKEIGSLILEGKGCKSSIKFNYGFFKANGFKTMEIIASDRTEFNYEFIDEQGKRLY